MRDREGTVVKKGDFVVIREEIMGTRCIGQIKGIRRVAGGGGALEAFIKLDVGCTTCVNTGMRKAKVEELI